MSDQSIPDARRILVIDDDADLVLLVKSLLGRVGFETISAGTAVEGMTLLRRERVDLLILDLMLPDEDGLSLLERLRRDPRYHNLPVLILSARVDPAIISKGLELGADAYITKPYLPHTLTERVRTLLDQGRRQPE